MAVPAVILTEIHPVWRVAFFAAAGLVVYGLGTISARQKARREGGWSYLDPGIVLLLVALATAGLTVIAAARFAIPTWSSYFAGSRPDWSGLIVPSICALVGPGFLIFLAAVGYRFNDKGFEIRCFWSRTFIPWRDIKRIETGNITYSGIQSAKLICKDGKKYEILTAMRGFREMIRTARQHGIAIKD